MGNAQEAKKEYDASLALLEPLRSTNPEEQELLYAIAETYAGEGDVSTQFAKTASASKEKLSNWNVAAEWFQKSAATWSGVMHPSRISTSTMEVRLPTE